MRTPSRLMQIRQEAGLEDPEIKHERSVHAALQMSLSCEDLALVRITLGRFGFGSAREGRAGMGLER